MSASRWVSWSARAWARRIALGLAFLAAVTAPRQARAEPVETSGLVAPRPIAALRADYPKGAVAAALVVVELVVEADGRVSEAHVVTGEAPFAESALRAVRATPFAPATRAGKPVAARIRVPIDFLPSVDLPHDPYPDAPPRPGPPPRVVLPPNPYDGLAPNVVQIQVQGARRVAGVTRLGRAEIRDLPGAFGDGFRAIETLPGVVPVASGLPFFFVRGAPPGATGYFLDGVRLPVLFHLGAGPSVVHPALVDRIDFYPGAAPAEFGRSSGGVVAGATKEPSQRLRGEANVRLLDAGALVEVPLPRQRGSALVAGRFGYPGLLLPLFAPNTRLSYWDYQSRVSVRVGERDTLTLFVLGSYDYLGRRVGSTGNTTVVSDPVGLGEVAQSEQLDTRTIFETEFHRVELRHDHTIPSGKVRTALTVGTDGSALGLRDRVRGEIFGWRFEWERALSREVVLRGGADTQYNRYEVRGEADVPPNPEFVKLFPTRDELLLGTRADVTWSPAGRLRFIAGMRLDHYSAYRISAFERAPGAEPDALPGRQVSVEPRLSVRVGVVPRVVFVSAVGIAAQPPRFLLPLPGLTVGRLREGLERSAQTSHGFEWTLPYAMALTTTFFSSRTIGLADAFAACPGARNAFTDGNACTTRTSGSAVGLELYLKRDLSKRIAGFVSYTLSRASRTVPASVFGAEAPPVGASVASDGRVVIPSDYDRTHVLNAAVAYDVGRGYRAGLRFVLYSGRPYTPTASDGSLLGAPNSARLPIFSRFDVRLEKRWELGASRHVSLVLEGLNVTLRKEATGVRCATRAGPDDVDLGNGCVGEQIGPITVPSLGVEGAM
ncbi:MAG: TonB family protein [Myxococcales bacterium]|nr:TonB family protein [Myxococcales bacterium]HQY60722.1 TonB family protein [Polyangiaceae bacterium]